MKIVNKPISDITLLKAINKFIVKNPSLNFVGIFLRDELVDKKFIKQYMKIDKRRDNAMIVNLDDSSGPGIHWVALYFNNNSVHYFDSFGLPPFPEILVFIKKTLKAKKYYSYDLPIQEYEFVSKNAKESALCGYYALAFIILTFKKINIANIFKSHNYTFNLKQLEKILKPF